MLTTDGEYILFNQVIVRSNDYTSKDIIINNIELLTDEDTLNADINYNISIGTSSDSLYKIKLYFNNEIKELCIDNEDEKDYFNLDTDITLNLNKFFILEKNTQYNLIIEFISKLGNIVVRSYEFSFGEAYKTILKGKDSDIKERQTNKSYKPITDLTGVIF